MFNGFTRFNLAIGQYLLYIYLIVLTIIVIHQITDLKENDARTTKIVNELQGAQHKIDKAHDRIEQLLKQDTSQQQQLMILLKILEHEQKESKHMEKLLLEWSK